MKRPKPTVSTSYDTFSAPKQHSSVSPSVTPSALSECSNEEESHLLSGCRSPRFPRVQRGKLKPHKYQSARKSSPEYLTTPSGPSSGVHAPMIDTSNYEYTIIVTGSNWALTALSVPYHFLMTLRWWKLMLISFFLYIVINVSFALLYLLPCLFGNATSLLTVHATATHKCQFWYAFEFSVETLSTIGYGELSPKGSWNYAIVMVESYISMLMLPIIAAIVFQKILTVKKLRHTIVFSQSATVNDATVVWDDSRTQYRPRPAVAFRIASLQHHAPSEVDVSLYLFQDIGTTEYPDISIEELSWVPSYEKRNCKKGTAALPAPYLSFPATIVHVLDEDSPITGFAYEDFVNTRSEILCVVKAVDDSSHQTIQVKQSYNASNIVFNGEFDRTMISSNPTTGRYQVDLTKFDSVMNLIWDPTLQGSAKFI